MIGFRVACAKLVQSVCRCFMGPSSAADAALFLEMVCGIVALVRCLRFVVSMGPGSAVPRPRYPHPAPDDPLRKFAHLYKLVSLRPSIPSYSHRRPP